MKAERVLITGGAGFVGSNLASQLARKGMRVVVFDNLSRRGTEKNLNWLTTELDNHIRFIKGDVRNIVEVREAVRDVDVVYHLAAQVAVTTSVEDPRTDLETNVIGTFNVLEACREREHPPALLFTSTNKVYGALPDVSVERERARYRFGGNIEGIDESHPLDFHSPYGCSKGAADQYVRDYSRIYGLPTVVFRMSCIYGPRQFGNEDQGWVAHFVISALQGKGLTIYGDGLQVRDVLFVEDLVDAFEKATAHIDKTAGNVYNIGGGPAQAISVRQLIELLEKKLRSGIPIQFSDWRPGDQKIYVSDVSKAGRDFGWKPRTSVEEGIGRLIEWVKNNRESFGAAEEPVRMTKAA